MRLFRQGFAKPLALVSFSFASLFGCGDDSTPMTELDAGPPPVFACDMDQVQVLEAAEGETAVLMVDTAMAQSHAQDLGTACGNTMNLNWPKQVIVQYTVPGTGEVSVNVDLTRSDATFDTVLQIREGTCETIPNFFPFTCFDNASSSDLRSQGSYAAQGGDVLFFVITGFRADDDNPRPAEATAEGFASLRVTTRPAIAPTLTSARVIAVGETDTFVEMVGIDADGDVQGFALDLFNAMGERVGVINDGVNDENDVFTRVFDPSVMGRNEFTGTRLLEDISFADFGITNFGVRVYDVAGNVSEMMMIALESGTVVGLDADCSAQDVFCAAGLACTEGVCVPGEELQQLCDNAEQMTFEVTDPTMPATTTGTGRILGGEGIIAAECEEITEYQVNTAGTEAAFDIVIPDGVWDLSLSTDLPANMGLDTVLYVRDRCGDSAPAAEIACADDITAMTNLFSAVELSALPGGTYTAFVELYGGTSMDSDVTLSATITPRLPGGAACTAESSCIAGACTDGFCPFPADMDIEESLASSGFTPRDARGVATAVTDCTDLTSCLGVSAERARLFFSVPGVSAGSVPDQGPLAGLTAPADQGFGFVLEGTDAVLVVGTLPPAAGYTGFAPYVVTTDNEGSAETVLASLSDPVNSGMFEAGQTIAFVLSRDETVANAARAALASEGFPADAVHIFGIPETSDESDVLAFAGEIVNPGDDLAAYIGALDWRVWRLTGPEGPSMPFAAPTRRMPAGGGDESASGATLDAMGPGIETLYNDGDLPTSDDLSMIAMDAWAVSTEASYATVYNADACLAAFQSCGMDNTDSARAAGPFVGTADGPVLGSTIPAANAITVYGVNHVATGLASEQILTLVDTSTHAVLAVIDSGAMVGTAHEVLDMAVTDRDNFFMWTVSPDCSSFTNCTEITADTQSVAFYVDTYLKPMTDTAPAASEITPWRAFGGERD